MVLPASRDRAGFTRSRSSGLSSISGSIRCARVALGQFHGRLDRQHRARRLVDGKADPVVARLGRADLCRLHEDDALHLVAGATADP
jgi:hypothetical protein